MRHVRCYLGSLQAGVACPAGGDFVTGERTIDELRFLSG